MTTTEKLQRIKARCEELLALAIERTPGEWERNTDLDSTVTVSAGSNLIHFRQEANAQHWNDASYIAACAGSAEAGWRATIALVDYYIKCHTEYNWGEAHPVEEAVSEIIKAWEGLV